MNRQPLHICGTPVRIEALLKTAAGKFLLIERARADQEPWFRLQIAGGG